jgi:hypothetical protein
MHLRTGDQGAAIESMWQKVNEDDVKPLCLGNDDL